MQLQLLTAAMAICCRLTQAAVCCISLLHYDPGGFPLITSSIQEVCGKILLLTQRGRCPVAGLSALLCCLLQLIAPAKVQVVGVWEPLAGSTKASFPQLAATLRAELSSTHVGIHVLSPGMMLTDLLLEGATQANKQAFNILCEHPETVAAFLVPRVRSAVCCGLNGTYFK